jgi:hypothetical protein
MPETKLQVRLQLDEEQTRATIRALSVAARAIVRDDSETATQLDKIRFELEGNLDDALA